MDSNTVKAISYFSLICMLLCFEYTNATHFNFGEEEIQGVPTTLPGELKFAHVVSVKRHLSTFFFYHMVRFLQIFRHGDRTPVDPYPTDPWNNRKYWPTGWGQLTNVSAIIAI